MPKRHTCHTCKRPGLTLHCRSKSCKWVKCRTCGAFGYLDGSAWTEPIDPTWLSTIYCVAVAA